MWHGRNKRVMSRELAAEIAANALAFIASDRARLARFLSLSGLTVDALRSEASSSRMLAAVLAHLTEDESLLLVFAETAAVAPDEIAPARDLLADTASRE